MNDYEYRTKDIITNNKAATNDDVELDAMSHE
jgi:hypothetical protein